MRPSIGISVDSPDPAAKPHTRRYESRALYSRAVADAGGLPVLLPHEPELAREYIRRCHGLILTGGNDPATEPFGQPTHRLARPIGPDRQAFELALLDALAQRPDIPALGICLGMQLMALHAGGSLDQYMPETLGQEKAALHQDDRQHPLLLHVADSVLTNDHPATPPYSDPAAGEMDIQGAPITSSHRQCVADPGSLRLVATAPDCVIEAIDDPARRFYLGVQWHPERGAADSPDLNRSLIQRFVDAARATT